MFINQQNLTCISYNRVAWKHDDPIPITKIDICISMIMMTNSHKKSAGIATRTCNSLRETSFSGWYAGNPLVIWNLNKQ